MMFVQGGGGELYETSQHPAGDLYQRIFMPHAAVLPGEHYA